MDPDGQIKNGTNQILEVDSSTITGLDNQIKHGLKLMLAKLLVNAHSYALDINLINFTVMMSDEYSFCEFDKGCKIRF